MFFVIFVFCFLFGIIFLFAFFGIIALFRININKKFL
nr:MAG TPA: hypothetical protein [Caudoviricetes sp.]